MAVHATSSYSLNNVLFVLKFPLSLQSPNFTQSYWCAIFYPFHCVFQELHTRMRIDSNGEYDSLYYLDAGTLHYNLPVISLTDTPLRRHYKLEQPSL